MNVLKKACIASCTVLLLVVNACSYPPADKSLTTATLRQSIDPEAMVVAQLSDELQQNLQIRVSKKTDRGGWLLLSGSVHALEGSLLDYSKTRYQADIDKGAFDNAFIALFQRDASTQQYRLLELTFGSSDTPMEQWSTKYSLPDVWRAQPADSESLQWQ